MAVHHATARKLATQAEWTLLQNSYGRSLDALSEAQLKQKVTRARTLRDKYRALAKQQRGEARGKRKPKSTRAAQGNANTKLKAAMFAEALGRFQERAAELKAKGAKKSGAKKSATKKAGAKKSATKKAGAKKSATKKKTVKKRPLAFVPPAEVEAPANPWAAFAPPSDISLVAQSNASLGARKALKFSHQSTSAHLGHVGSRARRNQAKRDSK